MPLRLIVCHDTVASNPRIAGSTETCLASSASSSTGLVNSIWNGMPGRHSSFQPQRASLILNGPYVLKLYDSSFSVTRGPSADGNPAANATVTDVSLGSFSVSLNATQRPAMSLFSRHALTS